MILYIFKKRKYFLLMLLLFGVYGGVLSLIGAVLDAVQTSAGVLLIWDKRVFEKLDVIVGQFSVNVLLRGVVEFSVNWL